MVAENCSFQGNFNSVNFTQWSFYQCSFYEASIFNSTFQFCCSQKTSWESVSLSGSSFIDCEFESDVFTKCDFHNTKSFNSSFHSCEFFLVNMRGSHFVESDFSCSNLKLVDAPKSIFKRCDLRGIEYQQDFQKQDKPKVSIKNVGSVFGIILLILVLLSVISLSLSLYLSSQGELTTYQASLFETCSTSWKMGFGAIVGIFGGKALK